MADFYIDPSRPINGAGTPSDPRNTWAGLTLTANNRYLQRRGTTYVGGVRPQSQNSSAATPLTIGAYFYEDGSDEPLLPMPIIDHNGGANGVGAVFVDTCANVVVQDVDTRNSNGSSAAGVLVRRSTGVLVRRCTGRDSRHGLGVIEDRAAGVTAGITIEDCEVFGNLGSGIWYRWGTSGGLIKRLTIRRNHVYGNGLGDNAQTRGGIMHNCAYLTDTSETYRMRDLVIEDNDVHDNRSYGLSAYMADTELLGRNIIRRNRVYRNGLTGEMDTHSLWVGSCFRTDIEDNEVFENGGWEGGSIGSGVGIFLDFTAANGAGGDSNRVRYNLVRDQFQGATTSAIPGSGIHVLANTNCLVEANWVLRCRNGLSISSSGANSNKVRNNTFVDIGSLSPDAPGGHGLLVSIGTGNELLNNLVLRARVGVFIATSGTAGTTEHHNALIGVTTLKTVGTLAAQTTGSPDATDVLDDQGLLADGRLMTGSSLIGAGQFQGYARDYRRVQRSRSPCIGAFEVARLRH